MPEFAQGMGLYLPDPLPGNSHHFTNLFKGKLPAR